MRYLDNTLLKSPKTYLSLAAVLSMFMLLLSIRSVCAQQNDAAEIFSSKCTGCHTIGEGAGVGPDLADTRNWTDQKLRAAVEKMSSMSGGLQESEISALVSYLKNPTIAKKKSNEKKDGNPDKKVIVEEEVELPGSYNKWFCNCDNRRISGFTERFVGCNQQPPNAGSTSRSGIP